MSGFGFCKILPRDDAVVTECLQASENLLSLASSKINSTLQSTQSRNRIKSPHYLLLIISPEDNFVSVFNSTGRMKLSISALVSILASGANAQVANPCLICRDGATAGDDFAPYAANGLNATCADLIKEIKVFEDGSEECGWFEDIKSACCPTTPPKNPCMVCPDGITATDDFAPYADWGDKTTCNELVELALLSEAGSELCSDQELDLIFCCPTAAENPCIVCPDGATAGDDFAPFAEYDEDPTTCKKGIEIFNLIEKESEECRLGQIFLGPCCPTTPENPCIMCSDGATAGDDFALYAEFGYLKPCKVYIDEYKFVDAESTICASRSFEEALCCPTTPTNPCNICPDGATAADDFIPFAESGQLTTCKSNIDFFKLIEADSYVCSKFGPYYKVGCCPNVSVTTSTTVEVISTAATTTANTATTTSITTSATTSAASISPDATTTSATGNADQSTTVATSSPSTEPITSGGVTVSGFGGLAYMLGVSTLYSFAVV
jgi:hypothetical protein